MTNNGKFLLWILACLIILLVAFHIATYNRAKADHDGKLDFYNAHITGLVLARGGSKGIRHKNLATFSNVTLLGNSLKTMTEFGKFSSVWVSTDDKQIAIEARKYNVNVHMRDAFTATDSAPSILAVKEFIKKHPEVDIVGLIQCTSPFLKIEYLEKAFTFLDAGYHSVFSVTRQFKLRWKISIDGTILPDNFSPLYRPRRQDWNGDVIENGMFYFTYAKLINRSGLLQSGRIAVVEVPHNESLEVDSPTDLIIANVLAKAVRN